MTVRFTVWDHITGTIGPAAAVWPRATTRAEHTLNHRQTITHPTR
ncbi:hypothetical protein [Streptomyces beijiangensis]|nr:hypothetical protein [Streptomyces beijiangensis]